MHLPFESLDMVAVDTDVIQQSHRASNTQYTNISILSISLSKEY